MLTFPAFCHVATVLLLGGEKGKEGEDREAL